MFDSLFTALHLIASNDPMLLSIVVRSLTVSATACALASGLGLVLGAWLGVVRFPGRGLVLTLLNTLLALPSVVVGLLVYLLLSRSGPLGSLGWLFTFKAMVLAQAVLVLPMVTALTRQTVEDADASHGEQLQSLGAGPLLRSLLLAWDERYAVLTLLIAAFGRAVSEVGAVMVVGGNIDGFTRVITTAIALETSKGDLPLALALGLVLLAVVLVLNLLIAALRRWQCYRDVQRDEAYLPAVSTESSGPSAQSARIATPNPTRSPAHQGPFATLAALATLPPLLTLSAATVHYGGMQALRATSLSIAAGERVALVGANGCGKSSLLRLLHGLQPPSTGVFERLPGVRQAMLFQRPHMLRASSVWNVALGLGLRSLSRTAATAQALLALQRVGLADIAARPARALSGGQQQRLALARAWSLKPDLLLLDEPTANLDPHAKREVEALMTELAEEGITLVFASHNLGQVKRLATRVLYLERGQVLADLPVLAFFDRALLAQTSQAAALFVKGELV